MASLLRLLLEDWTDVWLLPLDALMLFIFRATVEEEEAEVEVEEEDERRSRLTGLGSTLTEGTRW